MAKPCDNDYIHFSLDWWYNEENNTCNNFVINYLNDELKLDFIVIAFIYSVIIINHHSYVYSFPLKQ